MNYQKLLFLFVGAMLTAGAPRASAQLFAPGDLIVNAYGTSSSTGLIDGQAVPISLQVYSLPTATSANLVGSVTLSGIVGEYGSSSEGNIQLTGNGQYLTIGGYNASQAAAGIGSNTNGDNGNGTYPIGTPYGGTAGTGGTYASSSATPLAQSSPADVARVADVIDTSGHVVSTTSFGNIYNTNNMRGVYSQTGSTVYVSGQGDKTTSQQGVFYGTAGASYSGSTRPTGIYNTKDTRYVTGYGGNLYYSTDKSGSPTGIFKFNGMPTGAATATQITTATNGLTGSAQVNYSPEGFFFADANTLYVADTGVPKAGGTGDGGIQKWLFNGSAWTLQYTLTDPSFVSPTLAASATSGETGFGAITGKVVGGAIDLYVISYTAGDDNPNGLYEITDTLSSTTGSGESFTEIEAAPGSGQQNFKGLTFAPDAAPEPSTWALMLGGLGLLGFMMRRRSSTVQS